MRKAILILSLFFLKSCTYGYSSASDIGLIHGYAYTPHQRDVELFFFDTKPQKPFIQIAIVEIAGAKNYSNEYLINKLKRRGQELGADAIIGIKKSYGTRERGFILDILDDEPPEEYQAPIITGIAIKYDEVK